MQSPRLMVNSGRWTKLVANETFPNYTPPTANASTNNSQTITTVVTHPRNGTTSNVTLNCNGVPTNYQIPKHVQMRSPALTKIRISNPPVDRSKLIQIPEHRDGKVQGAYVVRLVCQIKAVQLQHIILKTCRMILNLICDHLDCGGKPIYALH